MPQGDGLRIVTTTTQVTDFVQQVAATTGATVTPLLEPGQSAHSFEAQPTDLVAIGEADVVIASGYGLETWLDDTLRAAGFTGTTIHAADGFDPHSLHESAGHEQAAAGAAPEGTTAAPPADDGHDHGTDDGHDHATDDGHDHAADPAATQPAASEPAHTDDHGADDGHGHDHGGADPHVWSAPIGAVHMVTTIADGLAQADAAHADTYRVNAETYTGKLAMLDEWIGANVATVPAADRLLVTNHHALTYYADAYHVTAVGSIMPSWDDNAEPSAQELDALIAKIKESGVKAVFSETQLSPATAEMIASQAGVKVYSGADALLTDALGAAGTPEATYIGATVHNTRMILDSWGVTATDLPAQLQDA